MERLQKVLSPAEFAETHIQLPHDEHLLQLDKTYKVLEEDYLQVLAKLASCPEI